MLGERVYCLIYSTVDEDSEKNVETVLRYNYVLKGTNITLIINRVVISVDWLLIINNSTDVLVCVCVCVCVCVWGGTTEIGKLLIHRRNSF